MARLVIGIEGNSIDLESLRRLVGLADFLAIPDNAAVSSNVSYVGVSAGEAEIKWDKVTGGIE